MKKTLYINAGAGSGKTYRLTHDLSDFLSGSNSKYNNNPDHVTVTPSEVIVTTFTRAAAAEIKDRARKVLLESNKVQEAAQLDSAAIGTIHSVAQQFINKYWYYIGSCPNQEVMTDEDKKIYRNQSLAKMLEDTNYEECRKAINAYFREFEPTHSVNNIPVDYPDFWVDDIQSIVSKATYYGINDFSTSIKESHAEIDRLFCQSPLPADFNAAFKKATDEISEIIIAKIEENKEEVGKSKVYKEFLKVTSKCNYKHIIDLYKFLVDDKNADYLFGTSSHSLLVNEWMFSSSFGKILKECVNSVFAIAKDWMSNYENYKRQLGVIDYDDMEKGFLKILDIPAVQDEIKSQYNLIMIDEFQDCNPMQLKIFTRLSDIISDSSPLPYSTIWVGDPNQAIYGFRGSDTELINRATRGITVKCPATDSDGCSYDALDTSYRSRPELVDFANGIFSKAGFFRSYTKLNANRTSNPGLGDPVLQWILSSQDHVLGNLARHIRHIVESKAYNVLPKDEDTVRPIEYKDIAILARFNSDIKRIAAALRAEDIPVSAPETDFLDRAEIQLVLALLGTSYYNNFLRKDNPHELATLLRLWADLSTEDVMKSRLKSIDEDAKDEWLNNEPSFQVLRNAIQNTQKLPVDEKITALILQLDLYNKVEKWGEADTRRQNLMTLQNTAKAFVERCNRMHFKQTERDFYFYLKEAVISPEKDNTSPTVKVYTYHGSKGLEWPMVILSSLDNKDLDLNNGTSQKKFIDREYWGVHEIRIPSPSYTLYPDYYLHYFPTPTSIILPVPATLRCYTAGKIYSDAKTRNIDEMKRLFYVGATRARDYLVFINSATKEGISWSSQYSWLDCVGINIGDINKTGNWMQLYNIPEVKKKDFVTMNAPSKKDPARAEYDRQMDLFKEAKAKADKLNEEFKAAQIHHTPTSLATKTYTLHVTSQLDQKFDNKYIHP